MVFIEIFNLPLTSCFIETTVSLITNHLIQKFAEKGQLVVYGNKNLNSQKTGYQGAFTYNSKDSLMKIQENLIILDFEGLYPNSAISLNVNPF